MRSLVLFLWSTLAVAASAGANDVLPPSNDLGITVTYDQLMDAVSEAQEFWGPVRKYVAGDDFPAAESAAREQALAILKRVTDEMHQRLLERDEATALDLLNYVGMRLRKFTIYRQLRETIGNDAALLGLMDRWERAMRDINSLPEADRPARVKAVLELMPDEMAASGVAADVSVKAMKLWALQAECMALAAETDAGRAMLSFDREVKKAEPQVSQLARAISDAADWAMITKSMGATATRNDFVRAWDEIGQLKSQGRTAAKPATP